MGTKITVKDLARMCGVSIGTVDRAINNRGGINEATKKQILDTAFKYGYTKNENAIALTRGCSNLIGVIIFNLYSEYFSLLLTSIENSARAHGYVPVIMLSGINADAERDCVNKLLAMNVAGIITCSCLSEPSLYVELREKGVPIIAVGNRIGAGVPYVGIDDTVAMYDSASYVASHGNYRHIVYLSPVLEKRERENIGAQGERHDGFIKAMKDCADIEITTVGRYRDYIETVAEAVADNNTEHAIICTADNYTIKCLRAFKDRLKPHGNIGLMGFDYIETLRILYPDLSSVSFPGDAVGSEAINLIISGGEDDVILPHAIIKGSTI